MQSVISTEGVVKTYSKSIEALKKVNLDVNSGSFFSLLGPNGAGKSTLVRLLASLSTADAGEINVCGMRPASGNRNFIRKIGIVAQENQLDPAVTVFDHLLFQGRLFGLPKKKARKNADDLIENFMLAGEKNKKANQLSGGNRRKLHCALSMVHSPEILFLDEPTVGMDPEVRENFWTIINGLHRRKITIFLTTQYLEEADRHAEDMALLVDGKIVFSGRVDEFKKQVHPEKAASLEESYLKYIKKIKE